MAATTTTRLPTITVVDVIEPSKNDKIMNRNCCFCIPERFGVSAIISMYLFFGLYRSATSFVELALTKQTSEIIYSIITGCLSVYLVIASALSISAIKKEKAVMMYRLSFAFWVFTVFTLIFRVTLFILDIVYRSVIVKGCEDFLSDPLKSDSDKSYSDETDIDCNNVVDIYLVKEALVLFVVALISIYFAYVIFKFANQMLKQTRNATTLPIANAPPLTPTYFVYATQPPTSNDWTPPPTYTVRPTNPLPDDFNPDLKQTFN